MNYYKRHIGDYHKKAGRLSMLQHGAYTLLLDACYDREKFPTRDEAIDWCWVSSQDEIAAVEFVLAKFFNLEDGRYVQSTISETVAQYQENALKNKQIAIEREQARKLKREQSVHESARSVHEAPPNHKPLTTNHKPIEDQKSIVDSSESEKRKRFTPPTFEQVDSYMQEIEKGSAEEAQKFVDFYESKGWMVGKNKMKVWKASVRTWLSKTEKNQQAKPSLFNLQGMKYESGDL